MLIFLWLVIILQWVMYIYIPIVCFAGLVLSCVTEDATKTVHSPYFGFIKVSQNKGILIWFIRLILLGAILIGYVEWYRNGISPFIPL